MSKLSDLQKAMGMLIAVFRKYSEKEGDKNTLSKGEVKELLKAEMGGIFGNADNPATLDKIFKDLDADSNGTVDFQEYVILVACITTCCHEGFKKK